RDLFNSGSGDPSRLYRALLRKAAPDFQLLALPQSPPELNKERREAHVWSLFLRRGEIVPIKVLAFRQDGFEGEIRLRMDGLPAGVSCSGSTIGAGRSFATLLVRASERTAAWVGTVTITGVASIANSDVSRLASAGSLVWGVNDYNIEPISSRLVSGLYLGVA